MKRKKSSIEALLERQTKLMEGLMSPPQTHSAYGVYGAPTPRGKASLTFNNPPVGQALINDSRAMYDAGTRWGGFFQDAALEHGIFNLLVNPTPGIAADIPVKPNNNLESKTGYLVRYKFGDVAGSTVGGGCCESCSELEGDWDFAKIRYPYGKLCRSASTICITQLILKAKMNQYEDFFIIGQYRGVTGTIPFNTWRDRDTVVTAAVQRKMSFIGSYFQEWTNKKVWTGDPTSASNAQQSEFYGLLRLIGASYHTPGAFPIETTSGNISDATALNSIVIDATDFTTEPDAIIGDGIFNTYSLLLDVEQQLYMRASATNSLPVAWRIYMHSFTWAEITKHVTCEMAAYGCVVPGGDCVDKTISLTGADGGLTMLSMMTAQQMRQSMTIELNGRTYPVHIDDNAPYEKMTGATPIQHRYRGSIFFIPFTVAGGEEALYWEHIDYREIEDKLSPIPGTRYNAHGWSDDGYYLHTVHQIEKCMKVTAEFQPRLIFKAPHLAARIDKINSVMNYAVPLYYKADGTKSGLLVQ